jgi:hypothetical protein
VHHRSGTDTYLDVPFSLPFPDPPPPRRGTVPPFRSHPRSPCHSAPCAGEKSQHPPASLTRFANSLLSLSPALTSAAPFDQDRWWVRRDSGALLCRPEGAATKELPAVRVPGPRFLDPSVHQDQESRTSLWLSASSCLSSGCASVADIPSRLGESLLLPRTLLCHVARHSSFLVYTFLRLHRSLSTHSIGCAGLFLAWPYPKHQSTSSRWPAASLFAAQQATACLENVGPWTNIRRIRPTAGRDRRLPWPALRLGV